MVAPLLAAGLVASGVMGGVYHVGKALENRKYWDDYYRNTGYRPRYTYRSGYNDIYRSLGYGGFYTYGYGRLPHTLRRR